MASYQHVSLFVQVETAAAVEAVRGAGKPVGVNAFDPAAAQSYLDAGAQFVLVGADVAMLARGSESLAARRAQGDGAIAPATEASRAGGIFKPRIQEK